MTLLVEGLPSLVHHLAPGVTGWVEIVAFGLVLIGVVLLAPEGVAGALASLRARAAQRLRRGKGGSGG